MGNKIKSSMTSLEVFFPELGLVYKSKYKCFIVLYLIILANQADPKRTLIVIKI